MENFASAATTPPKKRLKRCEFKGCRKSSSQCTIINHGCPEDHAATKEKVLS